MVRGVSAVWLPVKDMDRAVGFYRDVLGLEVGMQSDEWSELDANGVKIGLNGRESKGAHADGGAVVTFQPEGDDIDAEVERLQGAGVTMTGGISSYEWGRLAPFKDSEGNDLQLYAPPA